jgi:hypothetical protein
VSTATHDVSPSTARVAPVHADAGRIGEHPHPLSDVANPAAHVGPTGSQVLDASEGFVPAAHDAGSCGGSAGVAVEGVDRSTVLVHPSEDAAPNEVTSPRARTKDDVRTCGV